MAKQRCLPLNQIASETPDTQTTQQNSPSDDVKTEDTSPDNDAPREGVYSAMCKCELAKGAQQPSNE